MKKIALAILAIFLLVFCIFLCYQWVFDSISDSSKELKKLLDKVEDGVKVAIKNKYNLDDIKSEYIILTLAFCSTCKLEEVIKLHRDLSETENLKIRDILNVEQAKLKKLLASKNIKEVERGITRPYIMDIYNLFVRPNKDLPIQMSENLLKLSTDYIKK